MKRVDFENGTVTGNILEAALPMLVAQILNLLYNIVDRLQGFQRWELLHWELLDYVFL